MITDWEIFIPIPSTKHLRYLQENAGAVGIKPSKEGDARVRRIIKSVGGSKGARYPDAHLAICFGDSPEIDRK